MKLMCINAKVIISPHSGIHCKGTELVEGQIYTTNCEPFIDENGDINYYIEGLGPKLCCRFSKMLEQEDSVAKAEKAIEKLKEEFELN